MKSKIKETSVIFILAFLIIVNIFRSLGDTERKTSTEYHSEILKDLKVGSNITTGKSVYDILEGSYTSQSTLSDEGFKCLLNYKPKTSSGGANYFFSIKVNVRERDIYYDLFGYNENYFYLAPVIVNGSDVELQMKPLRFNCHYSDVAVHSL